MATDADTTLAYWRRIAEAVAANPGQLISEVVRTVGPGAGYSTGGIARAIGLLAKNGALPGIKLERDGRGRPRLYPASESDTIKARAHRIASRAKWSRRSGPT